MSKYSLVNVIPAISTVKNGISWRQSVYYPLYFASLYGRGESLQLKIKSPKYSSDMFDDVNYIDASAVINKEEKTLSFFLINRSEEEIVDRWFQTLCRTIGNEQGHQRQLLRKRT